MRSPLLTLAEHTIALLLAFPLVLLSVYGVTTYADDRDMATLIIAGAFASLGAFVFFAALRCVNQGRRDLTLQEEAAR